MQTAIPSRLREGSGADAYTAYTFQAKSKAREGVFIRLRPSATNRQPQPRVRVGNIIGDKTSLLEDTGAASRTKYMLATTQLTEKSRLLRIKRIKMKRTSTT